MRRSRKAKLFLAAAIAAPTFVHAQVSGTWINPNSGTWTNVTNWSSNPQYPDGGGTAVLSIRSSGATTITLDTNPTLSEIDIGGPSRYFITSGGTVTLTGPAIIDASGPTSAFPLNSSSGASVNGMHVINGAVAGSAGLVKNGNGWVEIRGSLLYTGATIINGGTLSLLSPVSIPPSTDITLPGALTLNGGALSSDDNDSEIFINQPITVMSAGGTIGNYQTGLQNAISIQGAIGGTGTLLLTGKASASTAGFTLKAASDLSGSLITDRGLMLTDTGALTSVNTFILRDSVGLNSSSSSTAVVADRINDSAPIEMRGGGLTAGGQASSPVTERVGTVYLQSALNRLYSDGFTKLSIPQIVRTQGATAQLLQLSSPTGILIDTPPALSGSGAVGTPDVGIVPWASAQQQSLNNPYPVTVESGYLRSLTDSEFTDVVPSGVTSSNLRLQTADGVLTAPATVNSLTVVNRTLSGSDTLTVSSGAIFMASNSSNGSAAVQVPIALGAAEGIIYSTNATVPKFSTFSGPISGTGGLSIAGDVALTGTNTYTGQTTVSGILWIGSDVVAGTPGPLGSDSSAVVIQTGPFQSTALGGELQFGGHTTPLHFDRDLSLPSQGPRAAIIGINNGPPATEDTIISGDISLAGNLELQGSPYGKKLILSGDISGTGQIRDLISGGSPSGGYVSITGNNSFSGGFELAATGTLELGSDTALGTGTFWVGVGSTPTIVATGGARMLANPIIIGINPIIAGSDPLTFSGPINLRGNATVTLTNSALTRFTGEVFNGNLSKAGTGVLEMSHARLPALTVAAGQLRMITNGTSTGTSRLNALTIAAGATLDMTDNDMVIDYTGTSPISTIQQMLTDGRLFSSQSLPMTTGLGYGENSVLGYSTFSGQSVDSTSLLIKYTWFGDADLDGDVDAIDLGRLGANWLSTGVWTGGDFDNNGFVNVMDVYLLALNWGSGVGAPLAQTFDEALSQTTFVPEPMCLFGLPILTWSLKRPRRATQGIIS